MIPVRQKSKIALRRVILCPFVALLGILQPVASMPEEPQPARHPEGTVSVQTENAEQKTSEPDSGSGQKVAKKERRGEIVIAPIPISSPAIGSGLLLGFGYVFPLNKDDKVS